MFEESIFPLHTPNPPISQPSSVPEHPSLPPPKLVNLALPESNNEDEDIPQPLVAPPPAASVLPSQSPSSHGLPPPAPSAIQHSALIPHCIQRPDPINVILDQHQHFAAIRVWDNTAASYLSAVHVLPSGNPNTYEYAVKMPEANSWKTVMEEEMKCLRDNGTWELTDLLENRQTVKCRWVYLTKHDTHGNVTHYHTHLIAKGFSQTAGIDYEETFTPVARLDALRLLLSLTANFALEAHHINIKSAYFNGDLDKEIYMDQLKGFTVPGQESKVCCLKKALYGLKQAG